MAKKQMPTVLQIENVKKNFVLPHERVRSVKGAFTGVIRRKQKRTVEVQHALREIDFSVKEGEFFGILGRNGSGKSTLLKIIAGIYTPTKGKVSVQGKLVPFIELGVGFNPELTGRENVYLNGALLGFSRAEIDKQYKSIVEFAELEAFMDQKLKNYSSGMQVRLAFSVAIKAEADILLVDEVLAVGDADFQRKCFQYFRALKKNNKTVIFVTHDMNAVREYCDRAILINEGVITHQGDANKVANEYLRLFNPAEATKNDTKQKENSDRWGNGTVTFTKITAKAKEDHIEVVTAMKAERDHDDIVVGFRVKNSAGKTITGANTLRGQKHYRIALKAGETRELRWKLPNIFGNDMFTIDATIRLSDGVTFCDNWDNAAQFDVAREENTPYSIVPDVPFTEGA